MMIKTFAKTISKLPLSGKGILTPLIFEFYNSTNKKDRRKSYFLIIALLSICILAHVAQAQIGIHGLGFNTPIIFKIVFGLYACVNLCVSLTQLYLFIRCTHFLLTSKTYPRFKRLRKEYTGKQTVLMLVFTYICQIIFSICYTLYS